MEGTSLIFGHENPPQVSNLKGPENPCMKNGPLMRLKGHSNCLILWMPREGHTHIHHDADGVGELCLCHFILVMIYNLNSICS